MSKLPPLSYVRLQSDMLLVDGKSVLDNARHFEPILPVIAKGVVLSSILDYAVKVCSPLLPHAQWHIEVHQFRIEAQAGLLAQPTPEGLHRDGVDFVLMLLVARHNVSGRVTRICDKNHKILAEFSLTDSMDMAWVDDARVLHGVSPIVPEDMDNSAFRDVLDNDTTRHTVAQTSGVH
jgi:hypothetical protein